MKVISLNTWAARAGKQILLDFFERNKDVDIFCLQEIWEGNPDHASVWEGNIDTNLLTNIGKVLTNHNAFFRPHEGDFWGLAMFVRKDLKLKEEGDIFVHKDRENAFDDDKSISHARNLQYVTIETSSGLRTIMNFHGLWNAIDKTDTEERLLQSENIIRFLKSIPNPQVLCGDFNLLPEGKSLKMLENFGMKNLIKQFGITSTRSSYYKKPVRFADYALVSDGIKVNDFKVLPDEVSDHLAMYLDFE
jgi:endonuclease/exonuclease/phosphatase family metal-dependent hydrolase